MPATRGDYRRRHPASAWAWQLKRHDDDQGNSSSATRATDAKSPNLRVLTWLACRAPSAAENDDTSGSLPARDHITLNSPSVSQNFKLPHASNTRMPPSHDEPIPREPHGKILKGGRVPPRRQIEPSTFGSTAGPAPSPSSRTDLSIYKHHHRTTLQEFPPLRDPHLVNANPAESPRRESMATAPAMAAASSSVAQAAAAAAAAAAMESALSQQERPAGGGGPKSRHHAYSRKQKSLGLLCSNFVALYNRVNVEPIGLDEAARSLGVERRRIYDIVNVLESIGILTRKAKNRYTWIGFGGIPIALRELKDRALREKSGLAPLKMEQQSAANMSDDDDDDKLGDPDGDTDSEKLSQTVDNPSDKPGAPQCRLRSDHRKEKSLGLLTQNFVKLFLTMEVDTISLDEASKLLLGEGHEETNMRTKVRRLYDIANVLSSLNLIEKIHQVNTKKPAFRWLAKAGKPKTETGVTVALPPPAKTVTNKRTFGTDLTNIDMNRSNLDSIQKKAKLAHNGSDILKSCKLSVQSRLGQGSRSGFVYGPFHPAGAKKQLLDDANKSGQRERAEDWESLSASFRPQYQNQALGDLFTHYVEAWKSWYSDLAQGSNIVRQHLGQSAINQFL